MKIRKRVSRSAEVVPSSAQIVVSIDDLLTEILLRLPIKSLLRFRLVSDHWCSLIVSPQIGSLLNPDPNPAVGLFFLSSIVDLSYTYIPFSLKDSRKNPPFTKLKFAEEPWGIRVLQSCNGLLLCRSNRARDCNQRYYVYNPTTKKFSTLPKLDGDQKSCGMNLAYNPAKSSHYKAICVRRLESDLEGYCQYQFEVYSSEAGPTWRKCGDPFTVEADFGNGTYWNGAIHWISNEEGESCWYFNPDHEIPGIMAMPPIPDGWDGSSSRLVESCDHLHYISGYIQIDVYEMKRDYSEWCPKYRVDLSHVAAVYPGIVRHYSLDWMGRCNYSFSVFTLVRGEREEDAFLVLQIPGKVVRYNLVNGRFETICEFEGGEEKGCLRFPFAHGFQHIESLCWV